ncbi:MAG: hypothetical protein V5783_06030 [Pontiella sp.]
MNRKIKTGLTLGLGALFTGAIIAYSFIQPFEEGLVYRAFPAQASFVFKADNLDALLQSPVCKQLDSALGTSHSLAEFAKATDWIKWAAASEIAVADLPFRNAGSQKTWVAASWVGWRSPWLRWKLEAAVDENLKFLGKHSIWPIWEYTVPDLARGRTLTFSLTDNLLIACLSESPSDIISLINAYDQRITSYRRGKKP